MIDDYRYVLVAVLPLKQSRIEEIYQQSYVFTTNTPFQGFILEKSVMWWTKYSESYVGPTSWWSPFVFNLVID